MSHPVSRLPESIAAILTLLAATLLVASCGGNGGNGGGEGEAGRVMEEANELVAALQDYGVEQRDRATERLRDAMDEMETRIARMEEKVQESSGAARREAEQALEDLRERRDDMAEWISNLEEASADAWDDARDRASEAYRRLADAWEAAKEEL